ncbi:MAG: DUF3990 domain-containing protein [Lachnospiraceae bacterium]|nr:DUF3990 domain-containing protein [Lachnospiraceae bacterium]
MNIKLYHGSNRIIKQPIFGYGKSNNDYGLGFYCTEDADMAKEWAVGADEDGIANAYNLDMSGLTVLNLNSDDYCILEWLVILLKNRRFDIQSDLGREAKVYLIENFSVDYEKYDVIKGYRADDSYFSFAQDFVNNTISLGTLKSAMELGQMGEQVVLKSPKAFETIKFEDSVYVDSSVWYPKKERRDKRARSDYFELRQKPWKKGEIYMMQILDKEIKKDDACLR